MRATLVDKLNQNVRSKQDAKNKGNSTMSEYDASANLVAQIEALMQNSPSVVQANSSANSTSFSNSTAFGNATIAANSTRFSNASVAANLTRFANATRENGPFDPSQTAAAPLGSFANSTAWANATVAATANI